LTLPYAADDLHERERVLACALTAAERGREAWGGSEFGSVDWLGIGLRLVEGRWDDPGFPQTEALVWERREAIVPRHQRTYLAWRHRERGERQEAWAQIAAIFPRGVAHEPGDYHLLPANEASRIAVALALDEDDFALARAWLGMHDHWLGWSSAVLGRSEGQALWAQYHRQMGDSAQAYAYAQSALAHATDPRQPLALLAAHRLLGELDTDAGRYEEAASHLDESLRLADACAAPYERALSLLALAELRAAMADGAAALAALDDARAICTSLGAKPALARADALAARLSVEPARAAQYPGGLSAREVEVLRLVAQGMTDAQVADQLYLSPRTVGQHLRNIYNKLGVSTRNAASRFAIEHHLT
jgi:DNA-binding CsgD family transcriptional regulator